MEKTLDLQHDGKKAYTIHGRPVVCDESLRQHSNKAYQIGLRISTKQFNGASPVNIKKVTDGWVWMDSGRRFPLIIYNEGGEILNELFDVEVETVCVIWIAVAIKKNKKTD
jgi:hypothetical protein